MVAIKPSVVFAMLLAAGCAAANKQCKPSKCKDFPGACGPQDDGCGGQTQACGNRKTCGASAGCTPKSCGQFWKRCGVFDDGCGSTISCVQTDAGWCGDSTSSGDPFITGFDGSMFDFSGFPNAFFNYISHQDYLVNVHMINANLSGHIAGGTFIDSVGIQAGSHKIQLDVQEETGDVSVTVDGDKVEQSAVIFSNMFIDVHPGAMTNSSVSLIVETPLFTFEIFGVRPYSAGHTAEKAHLDILTMLKEDPGALSGAQGHTYSLSDASSSEDFTFHGPGTFSDYQVSDLFGSDFKFNLFEGGQEVSSGARRLQTADSARFTLAFSTK